MYSTIGTVDCTTYSTIGTVDFHASRFGTLRQLHLEIFWLIYFKRSFIFCVLSLEFGFKVPKCTLNNLWRSEFCCGLKKYKHEWQSFQKHYRERMTVISKIPKKNNSHFKNITEKEWQSFQKYQKRMTVISKILPRKNDSHFKNITKKEWQFFQKHYQEKMTVTVNTVKLHIQNRTKNAIVFLKPVSETKVPRTAIPRN